MEGEERDVELDRGLLLREQPAAAARKQHALAGGEVEVDPRQRRSPRLVRYVKRAVAEGLASEPRAVRGDVDRKRVVLCRIQRVQRLQARYDRDVMLWRASAEQNRHPRLRHAVSSGTRDSLREN
jgi:hypothetical protein